jgi:enoyl-CoA hydratase
MDVNLAITDDIALISLDDGKKNAMTVEGLQKINAALDEADQKAKAIVIAGRPGSFCAGFDLATMTGSDTDAIVALGTNGGLLATRLYGSLHRPRLYHRRILVTGLRHPHRGNR